MLGMPHTDTQYEVGTLGPDATERGEQRKVAWQFSSMLLLYRVSNLPDLLRLWLVKGAGSDQHVNLQGRYSAATLPAGRACCEQTTA